MADNPLIAAPSTQGPSPWAGVWIAEDIEQTISGVRSGSWIDGTLGVVGAGLDGLALVSDPVGALLQYGIAWLIEHVKPLSEALDWLAGDPAQIAAHAQTWRNMAADLREQSDQLVRSVRWDVSEWTGAAGEAYRGHGERRAHTLLTLSRAAEGTALITEGAGLVIGTVRIMVRDAIATVVSRLIVYAGELIATAGLATPLVAEQVATLCAAWAAKIARWLKSLISSLRELGEAMRRLGDRIIELRRGATDAPATRDAGAAPFFSKSPVRTNKDVLDNGPGTPMTSENVQTVAQRIVERLEAYLDAGGASFRDGKLSSIAAPKGAVTQAGIKRGSPVAELKAAYAGKGLKSTSKTAYELPVEGHAGWTILFELKGDTVQYMSIGKAG
jgi:hypothetical protein